MQKLLTKFTLIFASLVLLSSFSLKAQTLNETLENLSETAGAAYVEPIVSAFGSNLNSGWVSQVPSASLVGFKIRFKFVAVGSFFSDENKRFDVTGNFRFTSGQVDEILSNESSLTPGSAEYNAVKNAMLNQNWNLRMYGPTIVGSENEHMVVQFPGENINGQQIGQYNLHLDEVKGFLDELPALPQVSAQLTIGTVAGTNAVFRWFPSVDIQDLGKFSFFGIGFLHNPGFWMKNPLPLDIGIGYFYQKMEVGDVFESSASQYGLWASKTIGMGISITPYAGLTMETSTTTVKYTYTYDTPAGPQTTNLDLELEGQNSFGMTVGLNLKLAVIHIFADYKMAKTNTVAAGLMVGF